RRTFVLEYRFQRDPLGLRSRPPCLPVSRLSAVDGPFPEGVEAPAVRAELRGTGCRPGRRGPAAGGLLRAGLGAGLPGIPSRSPSRAYRQRRAGPQTALRQLRGPLAPL